MIALLWNCLCGVRIDGNSRDRRVSPFLAMTPIGHCDGVRRRSQSRENDDIGYPDAIHFAPMRELCYAHFRVPRDELNQP
jgi:hypothetical protein